MSEKTPSLNENKILINYLEKSGVYEISDNFQKLKHLIQLISDISWGEVREINEVIEKNEGTCTGKHKLFHACLNELGIPNKPVLCTFYWSDKKFPNFPEELQSILDSGEWEHGHNFAKVFFEGEWIDVDITFDKILKDYGFSVFPEDWDGETSFISVNPIRRWDNVDISKKKKELIEELSDEMRIKREEFLKLLFEWIKNIRENNK